MKRALLLTLACLLAGSAVATQAPEAATVSAATTVRLETLEHGILRELNQLRTSRGLRPVRIARGLQAAALAHSQTMLNAGIFQHESRNGTPFFERVKRYYTPRGFRSWSVGENLLYNTAEIGPDEAIKAWMDSPPHRKNMLAAGWREVGIGAYQSSSAGGAFEGSPTWVITLDFGVRTGGERTTTAVQKVSPAKPKAHTKKGKRHARTATTKRAKHRLAPTRTVAPVREAPADDDETVFEDDLAYEPVEDEETETWFGDEPHNEDDPSDPAERDFFADLDADLLFFTQ